MPLSYSALRTELLNDPQGLGYAPMRAAGDHVGLADALNLLRVGVNVERGVVESYEIVSAIVPAEWAALSAGEMRRFEMIIGAGQVDIKHPNIRAQFQAAFGAGTTTRANLIALQQRQGSRAEALFGFGVSVSAADIGKALGE